MSFQVPVRELCAFGARAGDLDLRFTPAPTAEQGIAGHRVVAARRGAGYRAEVTLAAEHRGLRVRGRADGFDASNGHLEEFKTHRGRAEDVPANHRSLHQAQARVYGWMLCQQLGLPALRISVVYFDIDTQTETAVSEQVDAEALRAGFEQLCDRYIAWAEAQAAHRSRRDAWLSAMAWPHATFRDGQRTLATAVYNAVRAGRPLLAQAPTGIGKTMATVFPVLKAMPAQRLDKLFFLTAKTPGRQLALDALATLASGPASAAPPAALRVLALIARDKACEHPDKACHGESCPLARGFFDRLPAARAEAAEAIASSPGVVGGGVVRGVALRHQVCPYYLAQEMVRWADVVVADYNHLFDASALLHALTAENAWRAVALVDEAHNLVQRAREMYTARLDPARLRAARAEAPERLRKPLDRLKRAWSAMARAQAGAFQASDAVPPALLEAARRFTADTAEAMAADPAGIGGELLQMHFDALRFTALAETLDRNSQFDLTVEPREPASGARTGRAPQATPCVRNIVPAPFLAGRFAALHATVLFSATLTPHDYHRSLLGLPATTAFVDIASPFAASQIRVHVAADVSTRYADRSASLSRVARLIVEQYEREPGNYLAFFSSFDYLEQVAQAVVTSAPAMPLRLQARRSTEAERQAFLDSFTTGGRQLGFAVLGGAFGEGIDLPGTRLIGAFIATLGLPQVNPVNESMRRRMHEVFGDGYAYAYLYPGLQKVVQAAGRVIRSPQDRGVIHLIDDRYRQPAVRALLPGWWAEPRPDPGT